MSYRATILRRLLRIVGVGALSLLALFISVGALVQFQQRLLRWRAERLLADIQSVRLYQSDWNDAQRLMRRWGAWGHYDGQCTASDCEYEIHLQDASWQGRGARGWDGWGVREWMYRSGAIRIYELFGGRTASVNVQFIVQDGLILRKGAGLTILVPPHKWPGDNYGYGIIVATRARKRLWQSSYEPGVLGSDNQLAQHPNYKAGRPGGCEICLMVEVTYATHTPQEEIRRLTSYDLSCLTRLVHLCTRVEDVLPAAQESHLYDSPDQGDKSAPQQLPPTACDIPIWALGRDAASALVVDSLSNALYKSGDDTAPTARVKIVSVLKGPSGAWPVGSVVKARPYPGEFLYPPLRNGEPLIPGHRYVVLLRGRIDKKEPEMYLDRCKRFDDSPQVIEELKKGFAQNDNLRRPEL